MTVIIFEIDQAKQIIEKSTCVLINYHRSTFKKPNIEMKLNGCRVPEALYSGGGKQPEKLKLIQCNLFLCCFFFAVPKNRSTTETL